MGDYGGTLDKVTLTIVQNPLLRVGEKYVLFLSSCSSSESRPVCEPLPTPPNETYQILGGPQGKFLVSKGLVFSLSILHPETDGGLGVDVNGQPLEAFLSGVSQA